MAKMTQKEREECKKMLAEIMAHRRISCKKVCALLNISTITGYRAYKSGKVCKETMARIRYLWEMVQEEKKKLISMNVKKIQKNLPTIDEESIKPTIPKEESVIYLSFNEPKN